MIQHMGRAEKKRDNATFLLLTLKWTKIEDLKEFEDQVAKRSRSVGSHTHKLFYTNCSKPMHNSSLLNQAITVDNAFLDAKSSIDGSNDEFEQIDNHIFIGLLDTKTNNGSYSKKSKK